MHVTKARNVRPTVRSSDQEQLAHATGRMQAQKLIELIDQSAPDEGVVDEHELEASFANGSRRIALVEPESAVVEAVVEGAADTTRRMSAVEAEALVAVEIRSESTMRMCAIQESELVALLKPEGANVEPPPMSEPIVTFVQPRVALPLPAPPEEIAHEEPFEVHVELAADPVRRGRNPWLIGAVIALAGAAAGLAAVLVL